MNKINLIRSAFKTIKQNKFRTFLTMLGIIIGVTSVIIMLAIGEGSKENIKLQFRAWDPTCCLLCPVQKNKAA
jgi:putative ABC transport system permease protein